MQHKLYETGDHGVPSAIIDRNGDVVLDLCKICGGAEAAMAATRMPRKMDDGATVG